MIEWVFYCIGIIFMMLFLKSILIRPIFFREKWQAGLGYGLPAILYFLLFALMVNSEYALSQIDIKNQYPMSGKTQVAVSGTVTPINPSSNQQSSLYSLGTVSSSVNFQNGLINLQNDLISVQNNFNTLQSNFGQGSTNPIYTYSTDSKDKLYVDANGKGTIIGDTLNKTYYIPGSSSYNNETKNTKNSVYFTTTWAAECAGYKASK